MSITAMNGDHHVSQILQCIGSFPPEEFLSSFMSQVLSKLGDPVFVDYLSAFKSELNLTLLGQYDCVLTNQMRELVLSICNESNMDLISPTSLSRCSSSSPPIKGQYVEIMHLFGWYDLFRKQYMKVFHQVMKKKVHIEGSDDYTEPSFDDYFKWLNSWFIPRAQVLFPKKKHSWLQGELHRMSVELITKARANDMFEIVGEYPESMKAINELREYAMRSDGMGYIGRVFKATVRKRLLHMGASTTQILEFYVSMIRSLRLLDPSELLLKFVESPVREYLKGRKDAVRCIVSSLTQGKESELHGELKEGGSLEYGADEDDEEKGPGIDWMPPQRHKELVVSSTNRGLDILAMLVSIYGSTDLFIVEYRALLSDKLLSSFSSKFSTDAEISNLELLKIRFGEEALHSCAVMLKDIEDSKRNTNAIHSELRKKTQITEESSEEQIDMNFAMISENYWPAIAKDFLVYHPFIAEKVKEYNEMYHSLKKPRNLHCAPQLGTVELELEFEDGSSRMFITNPLQATLIQHMGDFAQRRLGPISLTTAAELCGFNPPADPVAAAAVDQALQLEYSDTLEEGCALVLQGMMFWVNKGVIKESAASSFSSSGFIGDRAFDVVESQAALALADQLQKQQRDSAGGVSDGTGTGEGDEEEDTSSSRAADAQHRANMAVIEDFTCGMLLRDSMPLDRIHTMLKLLVAGSGATGGGPADIKFDMTLMQLQSFLDELVEKGKLEEVDRLYSVRR